MMRVAYALLRAASPLLATLGLLAETPERPKLPPDLDRIVQLANAAPPEFAADALLRVAAVTKVDKRLRIELIDRAFHLARGAQLPTPLIAVTNYADTGSAMIVAAAKLNLDALSLETRAVRDMLQLDKHAARELFLEIGQPAVESSCDQPPPDTSSMYEALAAVANDTFTEQERKKEEHLNLVMSYMSRASSASQLPPLQQMIAALNATAEQREILTTRLDGLRQSLAVTT